jgi:frataxin-like iron-binding protein CyaY
LTVNAYHELADAWLEHALVRFEELQDQSDEIDVEYSVRMAFQPPTHLSEESH